MNKMDRMVATVVPAKPGLEDEAELRHGSQGIR
jgi:hypothetical protein